MAACGDPTSTADNQVTLRVSAAHGLTEFVPNARPAGSTAYAMELVYEPLHGNARVVRRVGRRVILHRVSGSKYSAATLAESLRFAGLVRSYLDGRDIVAIFDDETSARALGDRAVGEVGAFALGPYTVEEQRPGRVRLRARTPRPIDSIELVEVASGEQWRQLLGHTLDVLPNLSGLRRGRFRGLKTIRVIEFHHGSDLSVVFNTADRALRPAVRRKLASLIDVDAVGRVACGSMGCEPSWRRLHAALDDAVELPDTLRVLVLKGDAPSELAARVVKVELHGRVRVATTPVAISRFVRGLKGDFQVAIMPILSGRAGLERFTSHMIGSLNAARYRNPAYDDAVAAGELDKARDILARDVPALPLFKMREFAAIDAKFCGDVNTRTSASWRWIADLRPCKRGEQP